MLLWGIQQFSSWKTSKKRADPSSQSPNFFLGEKSFCLLMHDSLRSSTWDLVWSKAIAKPLTLPYRVWSKSPVPAKTLPLDHRYHNDVPDNYGVNQQAASGRGTLSSRAKTSAKWLVREQWSVTASTTALNPSCWRLQQSLWWPNRVSDERAHEGD